MMKEYLAQQEYRKSLQAFIDRWRYNANRGMSPPEPNLVTILTKPLAPQAQSRIKVLEKVRLIRYRLQILLTSASQLPDLQPPEEEETENFKCVSFAL